MPAVTRAEGGGRMGRRGAHAFPRVFEGFPQGLSALPTPAGCASIRRDLYIEIESQYQFQDFIVRRLTVSTGKG
jgi:hypothetical protein